MLAIFASANAQKPVYNVGVFAPLYLDSLFSKKALKYKSGVPKFAIQALEFVNGAKIAVDSFSNPNGIIRTYFYDCRSYSRGISWLIKNKKLDSLHLIIAQTKEADFKTLANFAAEKTIPFVSATYPNDAGLTSNPFTIIMNSTLKSHCEAIYSYIFQNHATDKLYLFNQQGTQEDKVAGYIKDINEQERSTPLLPIETVKLDEQFNSDMLRAMLDSNRTSVIFAGSLDEDFAKAIATACMELQPSYKIKLIGMPNWEGMKALRNKNDFKDFPIIYTTPYYNPGWDKESKSVKAAYSKKHNTKAPELALKGYEAVKLFSTILLNHPNDFMSHLNDYKLLVFCDYNFKPVYSDVKNKSVPDYFENKHLYFVQILNGAESKLQ